MNQQEQHHTHSHSHEPHVEVEVKIRVPDTSEIEQRLRTAGAIMTAVRCFERNLRYEDSANSLTAAGRVLRLREDTRVRLTYKEPLPSDNHDVITRSEFEVTVSDFETTDLLLQKLGYHVAWVYEKYRTTYTLHDREVEIVLDEMPYGEFVEIEGPAERIAQVLATLGLGGAQRISESYSELFWRMKADMNLPFRDLTFDNFKDVTIDEAFFSGPA